MDAAFAHPWVLALLPLALLPLLRRPPPCLVHSWLALLPADPLSNALDWLARALGALAIAATVLGLAAPQRPERAVERIGSGAQIVMLLDRSSSMDLAFIRPTYTSWTDSQRESKGEAARRILRAFAAGRSDDLFGLVAFSTAPIPVLPFTHSLEAVQAAIDAGRIGRGLAETDIGRGLLAAADYFEGREYGGSRVILMVSDGGARLDEATQQRIAATLQRNRIALYWIYMRSFGSPPLEAGGGAAQEASPEHSLHRYFQSLRTGYRAYEADDPAALERALADVSQLEHLPIRHLERLPREDWARPFFAVALAAALGVAAAQLARLRTWA